MSEHTREIWDLPTTGRHFDQSTESKNLFTMLNSVHLPYFRLDAKNVSAWGLWDTKTTRQFGGAGRNRTDDLLLAKQALSQLSYGPPPKLMVGPGRFELPTSRLSGVRSNQLSYGPPIFQSPDHASEAGTKTDPVASGLHALHTKAILIVSNKILPNTA